MTMERWPIVAAITCVAATTAAGQMLECHHVLVDRDRPALRIRPPSPAVSWQLGRGPCSFITFHFDPLARGVNEHGDRR